MSNSQNQRHIVSPVTSIFYSTILGLECSALYEKQFLFYFYFHKMSSELKQSLFFMANLMNFVLATGVFT